MLSWFLSNLPTILISIFLLAIVTLIIRYLVQQKRQGKHTCGGNCGSCGACSMGERCHSKQ